MDNLEFSTDLERVHDLILLNPPKSSVKIISNVVNSSINLLKTYIWSLNAIDEGDLEISRIEQVKAIRLVPWLISASKTLMQSMETHEELYELVSSLLSYFSGRGSCGPIVKKFLFKGDGSRKDQKDVLVWIREPSFAQTDIGWTTWGSAVLFGKLVVTNQLPLIIDSPKDVNILEIGCGTGLVGLTLVEWYRERRLQNESSKFNLTMTDYLDALIENVKFNVEMSIGRKPVQPGLQLEGIEKLPQQDTHDSNSKPSHSDTLNIAIEKLDWRECEDDQLKSTLEPKSFEMLVAADCIFDESHSRLVPQIIDRYLTDKPVSHSFQPCEIAHWAASTSGISIILLPRRPHYRHEVSLFEENMSRLSTVKLVQKYPVTLSQVLENKSLLDFNDNSNISEEELEYSLYLFARHHSQ